MKLNSLYINAFRGATKPITLHFSKDKNITLLYAENGNGKSSIADAFVCLCTDSLGSLEDKSKPDYSYLKSLGAKNSDLVIELCTDTLKYKAVLSTTSNKILKNPDKDLPKLKALRRAQITSFIEDTPSERYKVLSSFIDVTNIQKSETELKKLISSIERDLGQNTKSLSDANYTLNDIWQKEGATLGDINLWIKEEIKKDISKLSAELTENNKVLQQWNILSSTVTTIKSENEKYKKAKENFQKAEEQLKTYQKQNPDSESELLSLLNETKTYLAKKDNITKCPVCEKTNERQKLLENVNSRISKMKELNTLTETLKTTRVEKDKLFNRLQGQIEPFNQQITGFKKLSDKLQGFNFKKILENILDTNETKQNYTEFNKCYSLLESEIGKLKIRNEQTGNSVTIHNKINSNYESVKNLTKKCKELDKLLKFAKNGLSVLEEERKNFIDSELSSISGEVEKMYQLVHPKEGLGNVKLFLNHSYQSSLNLTANFHTESNITPQSVYSESHLDTLGICIFIALSKKESNKDVILILDDVMMSVDEKHLDRIIELIHNEAQVFSHVFITTHYRPWKERYRNNRAPNSNIQLIELRGWTKERGITLAKPNLVLDEIRFYLEKPENFHRENLAGVTGRFLEAILDFLSLNFQCKLKRKTGNDYTLSEFLDCFSKNLLKELRVQKMELLPEGKYSTDSFTEEVNLKPIIDNLKNLKAIRNQVGAHFTYDGALVSDTDIEDFANATVQLAELIICPVNGNLPDRCKSGSYWETKSGSIHLYPLIEP